MAKYNLIIPQTKRTNADLQRLQALPLVQKIELTKRRIHQWITTFNGNVYGAFSGGKDSTVLMDLIWQVDNTIPAVFSNTGLEYPEIVKFVLKLKKQGKPIEIIKPKITFKAVIDKYGYPVVSKEQSQFIRQYRNAKSEKTKHTRLYGNKHGRGKISDKHLYLLKAPFKISDKCCEKLKKEPFYKYEKQTGRKPIIGTMAAESQLRQQKWLMVGCNGFNSKRQMSTPMAFWTEQDVLNYIKINNLDYCKDVYGEIIEAKNNLQLDMFSEEHNEQQELKCSKVNRTGCMFCLYALEFETNENDGENRFTKMKHTHPKIYDYCISTYQR